MKIELQPHHKVIVVTGPESCGKTTLAQHLSNTYNLPLVEEYARIFLQSINRPYTQENLITILDIQNKIEQETLNTSELIICDTDHVTVDIWSREVFDTPIQLPIPNKDKKLYLLCAPDIPWEPDPLRENPEDRERLFKVYIDYLRSNNCNFLLIQKERDNVKLHHSQK